MRILFTFIGGSGHLQPLIPVARAAAAAGHTVAIAGSVKQTAFIRDAGFEAFSTSSPPAAPSPTTATRDPAPLEQVDRENDEHAFADTFARRGARRHASAVLEVARTWKPDVIVRDEADFGSGIAAERMGVPCAVMLVLAAGSLLRRDLVAGPLDELRADHELAPDPTLEMLDGSLVLSPFPASFRHPDFALPPRAFSFRSTPATAVHVRADVPTVYFTLGTSFNRRSGDLMERVLAGLHGFPGRVVATIGTDIDPAELPPQPDHIRIERYLPQLTVLPTCDVVISHGGSGSVLGALAHGLPMVLLPMGADQAHNASESFSWASALRSTRRARRPRTSVMR